MRCLSCVIFVAVLLASRSNAMQVKLKALKCFVDRPEVFSIEKCYVQAVSRTFSTFNLIANFKNPVYSPILVSCKKNCDAFNRLQLTVVIYYRYGTIFREVINPPTFEWCSSVESLSANVYLKPIHDLLKDTAPQIFQKCPYKVSSHNTWKKK